MISYKLSSVENVKYLDGLAGHQINLHKDHLGDNLFKDLQH